MSVEVLRDFLLGCFAVNAGILLLWGGLIAIAGDLIYRVHSTIFKHLSRESFDAIHYGGMAVFKTAVVGFNGVPALVLWLM
jgi:hypothetical protein